MVPTLLDHQLIPVRNRPPPRQSQKLEDAS